MGVGVGRNGEKRTFAVTGLPWPFGFVAACFGPVVEPNQLFRASTGPALKRVPSTPVPLSTKLLYWAVIVEVSLAARPPRTPTVFDRTVLPMSVAFPPPVVGSPPAPLSTETMTPVEVEPSVSATPWLFWTTVPVISTVVPPVISTPLLTRSPMPRPVIVEPEMVPVEFKNPMPTRP